jgi:hypothetical protein
MDATMVRLLAGGVLAAHGIGHVLGWMPAFGIASFEAVSSRSWALTPLLGDGPSRIVAGAAFLVPTVAFVAAGIALATGQPAWRPLALVGAVVSLAACALYPQAFTPGSMAGSVAVNLVVLYAVLVAGWGATAQA